MQASYEAPVTVTVAEPRGFWWGVGVFIQSIASLVLRLALAVPFFKSGLTKWDGFLQLSPSTPFLFQNEFQLHILDKTYPIPYPEIAAWGAGFIEIVAPAMLVIGFFTRFAALALLGMAIVIYFVFPLTWATEQLPWGAMALALVAYGAGVFSFDYAIWRAWRGR